LHQMTRVVGALDAAPGRGSSPECPRESDEAKGGSWPALSCASTQLEARRRQPRQLSEETKAEARGMLLLCARDGACAWGHAAQQYE